MNIIKSYIVTNVAASQSGGGGSGTVTSVGGFSPLFTVTNPTATPTFVAINQNANLVYAGPATGAAAAPTFRALVAADLPSDSGAYIKTAGTSTLTANVAITGADFNLTASGQNVISLSASGSGTKTLSISNSVLGSLVFSQSLDEIRLTDSRVTKKGIQYAASGYETTDLSLTSRGYVLSAKTYAGSQTFRAGTATALTAPLYLQTGTALATPEDGALEYHGSHIFFTIGSTRYQLDQQTSISGHVIENNGTALTQRANLNFADGLEASDNTPDTDVRLGSSSPTGNPIFNTSYIPVGSDVAAGNFHIRANYLNVITRGPRMVVNTTASTSGLIRIEAQSTNGDPRINWFSSGTTVATIEFEDTRTTKVGFQYASSAYGADFGDATMIHRLYADARYAPISVAGTVTSVAVSGGTTGLTTSGGPITTAGTITLAGTLIAANGGTGQTVYVVGDLLYASTTTALSRLAAVATGQTLISAGTGTAPAWSNLLVLTNNANAVYKGILVANTNGGSGTFTGIYLGNDTAPTAQGALFGQSSTNNTNYGGINSINLINFTSGLLSLGGGNTPMIFLNSTGALFTTTNAGITANTRVDIRGIGTTTNIALRVADSANTLRFTMLDNGSVGFYGVAAVARQAGLTAITHTAPGTPDYAIQDLVAATGFGFVTKDEGNTVLSVIKAMQDALKLYGLLT